MKSATAQEPSVPHRVHNSPPSAGGVYPTRIRKPKRRNMPTAPSSSRSRTRAADLKDRSTRHSPNSQSLDTTPSSTAKDDITSTKPPSDTRQSKESNPKDSSDIVSQEPRHSQRNAQRSDKPDKQRNSHGNASPSFSPPSTPPPATASPWAIEDLRLFAKHVLDNNSINLTNLFPSSPSKHPEGLTHKSQSELRSLLESLKAPFDSDAIQFVPTCGPAELAAATFSQIQYLSHQASDHDSASAKYAKARVERLQMEKSIEKLRSESKFLSEQIDKERERREKLSEEMRTRQSDLEVRRRKLKDEAADTTSFRGAIQRAKSNDLDTRRRLDRMRLKVAALRGEMITSTVDRITTSDQTAMELEESMASIDSDPMHFILGDSPSKRKPVLRVRLGLNGSDETEAEESMGPSMSRTDDLEYDEDAEETQLRLLRNRLAMCETEAKEWQKSLESEKAAVKLVMKAKTRLEEGLARVRQPGHKAGTSSARGTGKGNSGSRMAAKLRAQARISSVAGGEGIGRKSIKKSRKSRPRRSLVPY